MTAQHGGGFAAATVRAAQQGDREALHELLAEALPLVYNIVGCALQQHSDVDDVVQETMVRAVRGLGDLRDPGAFRSWLVAVAIRQVRDLQRARQAALGRTASLDDAETVPDPAADFAELTILRLGLSGQRKEIAEAGAWLDSGNRELLALWWMEEAGYLGRGELAESLGVPANQVAVRIQRMKQQLTASRVVVRALKESGRCGEFSALTRQWDGTRSPLWRKRLTGHTKQCAICDQQSRDLIPAEKLLVGLPLVAAPVALAAAALHEASLMAGTPGSVSLVNAGAGRAKGVRGAKGANGAKGAKGAKGQGLLTAKSSILAVTAASAVAVAATVIVARGNGSGSGQPVAAPVSSSSATLGSSSASSPSPAPLSPTPSTASTSSAVKATPSRSPSPSSPSSKSAAATVPSVAPPHANGKKGVAAWSAPGLDDDLTASGAAWYYDWSPSRLDHLSGTRPEFVPMIWGPKNADDQTLGKVKSQGTALLGFNEPDMAAQSNMTVAQALDLWPKLQATGLRLGSPAVAMNAATPGGWLDQFMSGAAARGYRVDFITVHWYGSDFRPGPAVDQLRGYLQAIHDRYHLPIWVTEYALIKFSGGSQYPAPDQQAAFVSGSAAMLEGLPYVERFAWFGLAADGAQVGTALYQGKVPTLMGTAFAKS
ncbi:hypothetical protein GCM10009839_41110 [Catenulispora yoronensis]|uniref:RNA polymerase sigma factor, sigma-70 family n=1 Tax=Catenulispora yoronensis TaxID=450799 RepID=A0ABP5FXJ1_9ACTN